MYKLESLEGRYQNHLGLYAMTLWYSGKRYKLTYTDAEQDTTPHWNRQELIWRPDNLTVTAVFRYRHLRQPRLEYLEIEER